MNKVLEFIHRRFPQDSNWLTGNCYHFALILSSVFNGDIFYDTVAGHFVTRIDNVFYDWSGEYKPAGLLVEWESFHLFDSLQKGRIIRDCIL